MAKKPEERYQRSAQVAAELLPFFVDEPAVEAVPVSLPPPSASSEFDFSDVLATPPPGLRGRAELLKPWTWGNWLWVVVAGIGALAALVIGLMVRANR